MKKETEIFQLPLTPFMAETILCSLNNILIRTEVARQQGKIPPSVYFSDWGLYSALFDHVATVMEQETGENSKVAKCVPEVEEVLRTEKGSECKC